MWSNTGEGTLAVTGTELAGWQQKGSRFSKRINNVTEFSERAKSDEISKPERPIQGSDVIKMGYRPSTTFQ